MKHNKKNNTIALLLSSLLVFFSNISAWGQNGNIGSETARQKIDLLYDAINKYAKQAFLNEGRFYNYKSYRENVLTYFEGDDAIITADIRQVIGKDCTEEVKINSYLKYIDSVCAHNILVFHITEHYGILEDDDTIKYYECKIRVDNNANSKDNLEYYYTCNVRVGLKNSGKIVSIKHSDFKLPPPPRKPATYPLMFDIGAGVKFPTEYIGGVLSVGVSGLSNNWFIRRFRFGFECIMFNVEAVERYPENTQPNIPSTLSYSQKQYGWGLLFSTGYMLFPWIYDDFDDYLLNFAVGLGIGTVFHNYWSSQNANGHETSTILKPSLRMDVIGYDITKLGIEAGYCICPNNSHLNGFQIQLIITL